MYNMSPAKLKTLDNYINNALAKEWICKSQSFANAFILFVLKKNDELCLCINYCELNTITIKNCYSLSLASKLLNQLDSSVVFSKIDLWNAYYRIQIRKNDEWKTAFCMWYNYFEYLVLSFDLINAPAIFQAYINHVLYDLVNNFCIVYLDDILIFSKIKKEHYQHLELIIEHL